MEVWTRLCCLLESSGIAVVQSLSCVWPFVTLWTLAHQASLSFTISWTLLKLMSIVSMMPSNHLIICFPLLLLPSIFPRIRVFPVSQLFASVSQNIGASASASVLPMNIQCWFTLRLLDLLAVQGTLKSLLQHHNLKASILQRSAFFVVQLHLYTFFFIVVLHSRLLLKTSVWESSILYKSRKKWYHEPLCIWPYQPT